MKQRRAAAAGAESGSGAALSQQQEAVPLSVPEPAPNKALQLTAYSLRFAVASGSS
jgi:hypothetical protein